MNERELYDFIKYFTFRFFGQEFTDYKMFKNCLYDFKIELDRASHDDMWPETAAPKLDKDKE